VLKQEVIINFGGGPESSGPCATFPAALEDDPVNGVVELLLRLTPMRGRPGTRSMAH
jgi:hypothetical protein